MSTTNGDEELCVREKARKGKNVLKSLIDNLDSINLPSFLWKVHVDLQPKLLSFSMPDTFQLSKAVVLTESSDAILKIDVFLNNAVMQIPYVPKSVSSTQQLNTLLKAVDSVDFCKYYVANKENGCLVYHMPFTNVCTHCLYKSSPAKSTDSKTELGGTEISTQSNTSRSCNETSPANLMHDVYCILCEKVFTTREQLAAHVKIHIQKNNNDQFNCTICLEAFADVRAVLVHYKNYHSNVKFISCTMCKRKFVNVQQLRGHIRNHKEFDVFTCSHCSKRFKNRRKLYHHSCMQNTRESNTCGLFICVICNSKFATKRLHQQHQKEHRLPITVKCQACKSVFDRKDQLVAHTPHCNLKRLNHICRICKKRFSCISQKLCHMKNVHNLVDNTNTATKNTSPSLQPCSSTS